MTNKTECYIVAISNSEGDGVEFRSFKGSKQEVMELLIRLIKIDKGLDEENFDYGTECVSEVSERDERLNAYAVYSDYHIDYTAVRVEDIKEVVV